MDAMIWSFRHLGVKAPASCHTSRHTDVVENGEKKLDNPESEVAFRSALDEQSGQVGGGRTGP